MASSEEQSSHAEIRDGSLAPFATLHSSQYMYSLSLLCPSLSLCKSHSCQLLLLLLLHLLFFFFFFLLYFFSSYFSYLLFSFHFCGGKMLLKVVRVCTNTGRNLYLRCTLTFVRIFYK